MAEEENLKPPFAKASEGKEETGELKKKLEDCQKKSGEYLAGWQRSRADFLNYKKEEMTRIGEILKYANEDLIFKMLPILDNFDAAGRNLLDRDDKNIKGLLQIRAQLQDYLKNQGVEEIKSVGEKFDPNFHEVVEEVEGGESGIITEEVQKGYTINGRLLRPAKVKINK